MIDQTGRAQNNHRPRIVSAAAGPKLPMLERVHAAFVQLSTGTPALTLDGRHILGLPDRLLGLTEVQAWLLERGCPRATRDAAWAELVRRARGGEPEWAMACVGMALPALRRACRVLSDRFAADPGDVHAAVLAGFLDGLARVDLGRGGVLVSLRWRAYRAGMAAVREALDAPAPITGTGLDVAHAAPAHGHPDLVLARAVDDGVITAAEAALIGSTRLEQVRLVDAARARGQSYPAANTARHRAERRLRTYLTARDDTLARTTSSSRRTATAGSVPRRDPGPTRPHRPSGSPRPRARHRDRAAAHRTRTVTPAAEADQSSTTGSLVRSGDLMPATPVADGVHRQHPSSTGAPGAGRGDGIDAAQPAAPSGTEHSTLDLDRRGDLVEDRGGLGRLDADRLDPES